jgi:hypothetical protein
MFVTLPVLSIVAALSVKVADRLPDFDPPRICGAAIQAVGSARIQSVQQCIADEKSARTEIESHWAEFSPVLRNRCIAETQIGGSPSYVDVLECLRFGARQKPM